MAEMTLSDIAEKMRDIDIAMLSTHTDGGAIASRPMSNNRDVEFDGDSYYFTWEASRMVSDIGRDPKVTLSFQGSSGLLGTTPFLVAVEGTAEVIRDKARFEEHWNSDLERYFPDGIDTPGVVMLKVNATRVHYWNGEEDGEVKLNAKAA
jgi:general stress protein 26